MATLYSTNGLKQLNAGLDYFKNQINPNVIESSIKYVHATYTMTGSEAASDIIRLVWLPEFSEVIPTLSSVTGNAVATTATLHVGDLDTAGVGGVVDADRYAVSLDVAASGLDLFSAGAGVALQTPYRLGAGAWITATFATLATPVAGKILTFRIAYVTP
jgi:hypothetical protein